MTGEIILYTSEEGETRLDIVLVNEGDLEANSVVAQSATTAVDCKVKQIEVAKPNAARKGKGDQA